MTNNIFRKAIGVIVFSFVLFSCQKISRPAAGDYPRDANPPGGPLKFYVAFDGATDNPLMNAVDSIKANFPGSNTGTFAEGITGKSYKGSTTAFASYVAPNDFTASKNFTIAFWMKKTPQTAGSGTNFAFSLNKKDYSWTNTKLFLEFEDWSTLAVGNCKFYLMDNWVEYVNENGMPNVTNGSWHQLAFTYDGASSKLVAYIDGVLFRTNNVGGPLGPVDFGGFDNLTIGGPSQYTHEKNGWMGYWENGQIDQFRMYGTVLSASEVTALYNSKL